LKEIIGGKEYLGKNGQPIGISSPELGEVTYVKISKTLTDKFNAKSASTGTGIDKKRALRFSKEDLDRKSIDYDVPEEIKIIPLSHVYSGPDNFDLIIANGMDEESGTVGTVTKNADDGKNERAGTVGTVGTVPGGIDAKNTQYEDGPNKESKPKEPNWTVDSSRTISNDTASEHENAKVANVSQITVEIKTTESTQVTQQPLMMHGKQLKLYLSILDSKHGKLLYVILGATSKVENYFIEYLVTVDEKERTTRKRYNYNYEWGLS
jgi:hypothetical protein